MVNSLRSGKGGNVRGTMLIWISWATFTLSKRLYVAIDDDADRAERRLQEWFGHNYGNAEMGSKVSVWGPAERVYEAIDGFIDAGAEHMLLNPVFDYEEHLDALARYVPSD